MQFQYQCSSIVKQKQNFSKGNYNDLRKTCNIDWSHILDPVNNSVEENWNIFKSHILESSKIYIPIVTDFGSWKKSKMETTNKFGYKGKNKG